MNNFSPLPASVSDPRLSRPEAAAPDEPSPALQLRRQKLRRIVAWVVGSATLLMCVGLVSAAIRSRSELGAHDAGQGPQARLSAPALVQTAAPVATTPVPVATPAAAAESTGSAARALAPRLANRTNPGSSHASKKHATVARSASVRH